MATIPRNDPNPQSPRQPPAMPEPNPESEHERAVNRPGGPQPPRPNPDKPPQQ